MALPYEAAYRIELREDDKEYRARPWEAALFIGNAEGPDRWGYGDTPVSAIEDLVDKFPEGMK